MPVRQVTTVQEETLPWCHVLPVNSHSTTRLRVATCAHQATSAQMIHSRGLTQQPVTLGERVSPPLWPITNALPATTAWRDRILERQIHVQGELTIQTREHNPLMSACLPHQATILIRPDRIVSLSHVMEVTTASWDHSLQHQLVQLIHQQTSLMILLMDATLEVSAKLATTVLRELQLRSSAPQASNAQLLG